MVSAKKPNTLAIIGNGFDMAHGYKTDYRSFVKNTRSVYLEKFKSYCEAENISTWYLFEDNIRIITEKFLLAAIIGNCNFDENRKEINNLAAVFTEIQHLLLNYLSNEITSKPFIKKRSIEKYIGTNTVAINFNYTQTAEKYLKGYFMCMAP